MSLFKVCVSYRSKYGGLCRFDLEYEADDCEDHGLSQSVSYGFDFIEGQMDYDGEAAVSVSGPIYEATK